MSRAKELAEAVDCYVTGFEGPSELSLCIEKAIRTAVGEALEEALEEAKKAFDTTYPCEDPAHNVRWCRSCAIMRENGYCLEQNIRELKLQWEKEG